MEPPFATELQSYSIVRTVSQYIYTTDRRQSSKYFWFCWLLGSRRPSVRSRSVSIDTDWAACDPVFLRRWWSYYTSRSTHPCTILVYNGKGAHVLNSHIKNLEIACLYVQIYVCFFELHKYTKTVAITIKISFLVFKEEEEEKENLTPVGN